MQQKSQREPYLAIATLKNLDSSLVPHRTARRLSSVINVWADFYQANGAIGGICSVYGSKQYLRVQNLRIIVRTRDSIEKTDLQEF